MQESISIAELVQHVSEYVDRVAERGERFHLVREGRPVAELRPVSQGRSLTELPALLASLPRLSQQEAAEFTADLEAARAELGKKMPEDPWAF